VLPLYWAYPRSTIGVVALPESLACERGVQVVSNDRVAMDTRLRNIIGKGKRRWYGEQKPSFSEDVEPTLLYKYLYTTAYNEYDTKCRSLGAAA
jgi:hypothetical protein